jgi:hypothetical protein
VGGFETVVTDLLNHRCTVVTDFLNHRCTVVTDLLNHQDQAPPGADVPRRWFRGGGQYCGRVPDHARERPAR